MNIIVHGRHLEVTEGIRNYAETRMAKLKKYSENIMQIRLNLSATKLKTGNYQTADVLMNVNGLVFKAMATEPDLYAAIDRVTDILEAQIVKHKEKNKDYRNAHIVAQKKVRLNPETGMVETESQKKIVPVSLQTRPMSLEEAILQLEALDKDFYVFVNSETETMNVVYKRRDGNYGHIEPLK